MSVTITDIQRIAHLARLHMNENDVPQYVEKLNNLLGLIEQMERVDTSAIAPMSHPLPEQTQRLREDRITQVLPEQIQLFQSIAPEITEGLYLVPKVIE